MANPLVVQGVVQRLRAEPLLGSARFALRESWSIRPMAARPWLAVSPGAKFAR